MTGPRQVTDPDELASLFGRDRVVHVYGLADLDEPLWSRSTWWRRGDAVVGSVDLAGDGRHPAFYAVSTAAPEGTLDLLVELLPRIPPGAAGTGPLGLLAAVSPHRPVDDEGVRVKMTVSPDALRPPPPDPAVELVTLDGRDADELVALHATDPGAAFLVTSMLDEGVHVGARVDGRLVAAGGTHARSTRYGVAAIGGVLTDPAMRGRRLAAHVVVALTRRLHDAGDTVGLNVAEANTSARRLYERLGFTVVHRYEEVVLR